MASGKYNRKKGHDYERQIAKEMRQFFPDAITSRNGGRGLDLKGIDLINIGDNLKKVFQNATVLQFFIT